MTVKDAYSRECDSEDFVQCVGLGWQPIVRQLFKDMLDGEWDKQVFQVKEKWGALRIYIGSATDEIFDLIKKAEELSSVTCEDCGHIGKIRDGSYIRTLCNKCNGVK
jgi:hypothetical protein